MWLRTLPCWNNDAAQEIGALIENQLDTSGDFYDMSYKTIGTAIIFDHKYFSIHNVQARHGTRSDSKKLKKALKHLGFNVKVYKDFTCNDIMQKVKEVAEADHSESAAFAMAILTHGQKGFLFANDRLYSYDIWNNFTNDKCPSLSNKPKLFFIEACQNHPSDSDNTNDEFLVSRKIPSICQNPDVLIAFSTVPGNYSFRNTRRGSWFIQALSSELKRNGRKSSLQSLLSVVCKRVENDYVSRIPDEPLLDKQKQTPFVHDKLTKSLVFP